MRHHRQILLRLLEESGTKLHGILYRLTLDGHTAENLVQELFCRLCQIENPAHLNNLEAYAYRTAINLAFDWRRQKHTLTTIPEGLAAPQRTTADGQMIQQEQLQQILEAARQLTGLSRDCFVLRYIEQLEYAEIAEATGKDPQHVRALCSKALRRIRQILNTEPSDYLKEAVND